MGFISKDISYLITVEEIFESATYPNILYVASIKHTQMVTHELNTKNSFKIEFCKNI